MKYSALTLCVFALFFTITATSSTHAQSGSSGSDGQSSTQKKAFRPTKAQITAAQEKLRSSASYSGAADGRYNAEFRVSLKTYQQSAGLESSGKLDEATLKSLAIPLTDKQKGIDAPSKPKRVVFRVSKEQIAEAQDMLKAAGSFTGDADGKYSKEFRSAIRDYQSSNGLKRKGSLNRATLEKMGIALSEKQKAIPVNPNDFASSTDGKRKRGPVFRATKSQITSVQGMLRSKGLYSGEDTGKLNPETRAAIKEWQSANGVKVTGTLNKATLEAMDIELTEKQKSS